jgi:superfamily I DNA/RNA helicase
MASDMIASLWESVEIETPLLSVIESKTTGPEAIHFLSRLKVECLDKMVSLLGQNGESRSQLPDFLYDTGVMLAPGRNANRMVSEIREWKNELFEANFDAALPPVEIYNLPSSKGLEGDVVFVIGLTDGLLPNPDYDIEEQSRLFFVAVTRARRKVFLFNARKRSARVTFQEQSYRLRRSRFIDAISQEHIDQVYVKPKKVMGSSTPSLERENVSHAAQATR